MHVRSCMPGLHMHAADGREWSHATRRRPPAQHSQHGASRAPSRRALPRKCACCRAWRGARQRRGQVGAPPAAVSARTGHSAGGSMWCAGCGGSQPARGGSGLRSGCAVAEGRARAGPCPWRHVCACAPRSRRCAFDFGAPGTLRAWRRVDERVGCPRRRVKQLRGCVSMLWGGVCLGTAQLTRHMQCAYTLACCVAGGAEHAHVAGRACRACAAVGVARRARLVHGMVPCLACACRAARRARPPGGWGGACAGAAVACGVRQVGDALQQPRTRWKASGNFPAVGPRVGVASWVWGVGREVALGLGAACACGRATAGRGGRALAPQRSGEQRATGAGAV